MGEEGGGRREEGGERREEGGGRREEKQQQQRGSREKGVRFHDHVRHEIGEQIQRNLYVESLWVELVLVFLHLSDKLVHQVIAKHLHSSFKSK